MNENSYASNYEINDKKTTASKSFGSKIKIIKSKRPDNSGINVGVVAPLKYPSNFLRSLDLPLMNCKIERDLIWWKNCVIYEISRLKNCVISANTKKGWSGRH